MTRRTLLELMAIMAGTLAGLRSLRGAEAGFQAAVEGPEGGLTEVEGTGGQTERGRHPAGRGFGPAAELLAPGDLAAGREAEPGGEVLFRGPPGHVETDLGDHLEGRGCVDAIDSGEIDAGEPMKVLASIVLMTLVAARNGKRVLKALTEPEENWQKQRIYIR